MELPCVHGLEKRPLNLFDQISLSFLICFDFNVGVVVSHTLFTLTPFINFFPPCLKSGIKTPFGKQLSGQSLVNGCSIIELQGL